MSEARKIKYNEKTLRKKAVIEQALAQKGPLSGKMQFDLVNCIQVSKMTGKLENIYSISTSVAMNPICRERAKNKNSVCSRCYAQTLLNMRTNVAQCMEVNYIILNRFLIDDKYWASLYIPAPFGISRIEAFGDVATVTCARNYTRIINTHPEIRFGVWTKNVPLWEEAMDAEGGKPFNMSFIVSSYNLNAPMQDVDNEHIDHIFTVYTRDFIEQNNIDINCGGRCCVNCQLCYNGIARDIKEKLK